MWFVLNKCHDLPCREVLNLDRSKSSSSSSLILLFLNKLELVGVSGRDSKLWANSIVVIIFIEILLFSNELGQVLLIVSCERNFKLCHHNLVIELRVVKVIQLS